MPSMLKDPNSVGATSEEDVGDVAAASGMEEGLPDEAELAAGPGTAEEDSAC